ncbi:beta strand repeat-containing protein, partial [Flavobacterium suaedae]|uniref:beta strand repeat-containing protein n=1 Tax=Flavobacterium suaedae TaxID=1767027 RepID=UPI00166CE898
MKQKLSYLLLLLTGLFWQTNMQAQTLQAGDIAIIGMNIDSFDTVSFIALTDLPAGEKLYFTDEGWENDNTWGNGFEGHIAWTIPAGVTCGTIFTFQYTAPDTFPISVGGSTSQEYGSFGFTIAGDQMLVYQSPSNTVRPTNPTFITGIHMDYNASKIDAVTGWSTSVNGGGSESTLPQGLTNGVNALAMLTSSTEYDNVKYTGSLSGSSATVLSNIMNLSDWVYNDTTAYNLSAAAYSGVNVTCGPTCTMSATFTTQNNVSCNGANDGYLVVTVTGGTALYSYSFSNGASLSGTPLTSIAISNLPPGEITVTVTDGNGCTDSDTATITAPSAFTANAIVDSNVTCNGGSNGSATVTPSGGNSPYTYLWDNGETTATATALTAGNRSVTITDNGGCTATTSVTITQPTAVSASGVATNVSCNGGNNGAIDLTVTGGTTPYTYVWNNAATTEDLSGLTAATYSVTVTDANGCTATETVDVFEPIILEANGVATNVSCNGGNDGTVDLTVIGGNPPYTFAWNNTATTEDLSGLMAGTYSVTVTDAKGCTATESVDVFEPVILETSGVATNVSCNGGSDGAINLTVVGGNPPYTYAWNNTATTEDLSGLTAGTYSVTITDSKGCTATETVDVFEPVILEASGVATNVSCNGGNDGAINLTVVGGNPPYTFVWNNSATTEDLSGLTAATYSVTITDSKGCTATETVDVFEPIILEANGVATNVSCNGGSDGAINLTVVGGNPPYTFAWNNSATTEDLSGLTAATYSVTITDSKGCTATETVDVFEPIILEASAVATDATCAGNDGSVDLTVIGGNPPYTYAWNNTATTEDLSGLSEGTYSVTVTDAKGCTATESVVVGAPPAIIANAVATPVNCNGGNDGAVDLTVTGGTAPYTFVWNNTATTEDLAGLTAGTYEVTVTDANGCTATESVEVTEPTVLVASGVATNVSCNAGTDGAVDLTVTGGTAPYTFVWNNTATTEDLAGLTAGTYDVTVTDANGCTATESVEVTEPTAIVVDVVVNTNVTCNGGSTGDASITVTGGTAPFEVIVNGTTFSNIPDNTTLPIGGLSAGTYPVNVTDGNGCTATSSITITEPTALVASGNVDANVSCNGGNDGAITVNVTGGTGDYSYAWTGMEEVTVVSQGFEATGSWNYLINPGVYDTGGDVWNIIEEFSGNIDAASEGTHFFGMRDLDNENGGGAFPHTITFEAIDVSAYGALTLEFDYNIVGYDTSSGDLLEYIVAFDNGTEWENPVALNTENPDTTSGWETATITVPASANFVRLRLQGTQNGGSDYAGFDNVRLYQPGAEGPSLTGLAAGTYEVTVTDANGCTATESVEVAEPAVLVASGVATSASCNGGNDGAVDLTVTGGTAPYTF